MINLSVFFYVPTKDIAESYFFQINYKTQSKMSNDDQDL